MNTVRATAGLGAIAVLLALGWLTATPANQPAPPAGPPAGGPAPKVGQAVGSGGCSGIACHGGNLPNAAGFPKSGWVTEQSDPERWKYSDTLFRFYDPHAKAYEVLDNCLSKEIQKRRGETVAATADKVCLACHSNPTLANTPSHPLVAQGITCEACHGNAGGWIAEHAGWAHGPGHTKNYQPAGMTQLSDPVVRATTCARCHVGAPAVDGAHVRDMNHDLIAAGHPRLNFDYGTYLRALPPHWVEKDRNAAKPRLKLPSEELTHWLVGRAASAAASYHLLADRAKRQPWPELAEFDCYACHHGLTGAKKDPLGARPGALVWNEPPLIAALSGSEEKELRDVMRNPLNTKAIEEHATRAALGACALAELWVRPNHLPKDVAAHLAAVKPRRWDEACHLYYALLAIDRKRPEELARLRAALQLPRDLDGARFNSPKDFDPAGLRFPELFRSRDP